MEEKEIVLSGSMTPGALDDVFELVKKSLPLPIKKVGIREIAFVTRQKEENDIVSAIREVILACSQTQALALWEKCKKTLQYKIVFSVGTKFEEVDIEMALLEKFDLGGDFVAKAFVSHHAYKKPIRSAYSTHYAALDHEVAEVLACVLKKMPIQYSKECVIKLGVPALYLLVTNEVENCIEDKREFFSNLRAGISVPLDLHFTAWLQHTMPDFFKLILGEVLNPDWPDFREMFYEVHNRTKLAAQRDKMHDVDDDSDFIKTTFKD